LPSARPFHVQAGGHWQTSAKDLLEVRTAERVSKLDHPRPEGLLHHASFSQVVAASGARTVYTAGQVSIDERGAVIGAGDVIGTARAPFFSSGTPPASTLVGVSALAVPDWLVEIEAVAVVD
jgi:enamine deaminase RidA (YjgF/YER057c/UK114 family)